MFGWRIPTSMCIIKPKDVFQINALQVRSVVDFYDAMAMSAKNTTCRLLFITFTLCSNFMSATTI